MTRPAWLARGGPRREKEGFGQGGTSLRAAVGNLVGRWGEKSDCAAGELDASSHFLGRCVGAGSYKAQFQRYGAPCGGFQGVALDLAA